MTKHPLVILLFLLFLCCFLAPAAAQSPPPPPCRQCIPTGIYGFYPYPTNAQLYDKICRLVGSNNEDIAPRAPGGTKGATCVINVRCAQGAIQDKCNNNLFDVRSCYTYNGCI